MSSFNRPNLLYAIQLKDKKSFTEEIVKIIKTCFNNDTGIIYCLSRCDCDKLAEILNNYKINVLSYHAGLSDNKRFEIQQKWLTEQVFYFKLHCHFYK